MPRIFLSFVCMAICACSSAPISIKKFAQSDYSQQTTFSVPYSYPDFHTEPEERGQASSKNYTTILQKAAAKDPHALHQLFYISANSKWDAAGAELHVSSMRRMLLTWGDIDFSKALAQQPKAIRQKVLDHLSFATNDPSIKYLFPYTFIAATSAQ